ncbi:hypothetical protein Cgig2_005669 [Carnegiea gigantea]|uniref:Endonuclease/exonuclease/phosphatase domain-containing protein n=1 Tax=Carnegiea gigantea TaxID=171969 RepID=A0A9Q1KUH8_9CARY|nr:hypothetical protein Cgig2_005669 [Carnegiea gigantea]
MFPSWRWMHNFTLNSKGRIWLAWKPNVYRTHLIRMTDQLIHCKVTQLSTNKHFYLSMIYGFNHEDQRENLWNDLIDIGQNMDDAWCLLGDFNVLRSKEDRIGGSDVQEHELRELANLLEVCELHEPKSTGACFSWTNRTIWSRIDHVFLNDLWNPLRRLHREHFSDLKEQQLKARNTLELLQYNYHRNPEDNAIAHQEKEAREKYISILSSSLDLIKQQGKMEWIMYGDECTRIFYAKAKQRKISSYIYTITDQEGRSVEGFEQVGLTMFHYYKNLLGDQPAARTPIDTDVIALGNVLTSEQQVSMCRPFSCSDIKKVFWSIPNHKSPGPDGYSSGFFLIHMGSY